MLKPIFIFVFTFVMTTSAFSQTAVTEANYRIYDSQGNPSSLEKIIEAVGETDVVFIGEQHDDVVAHFLQAEIFKQTFERYGRKRNVALSLEMFERDVQVVLDEYLNNLITEKKFLDDSRPWGNYKTDYRPLVEFAKANKLNIIAANAPRRYVNMVSRNGRDALNSLSPTAKNWLAPLPYAEPSDAYAQKFAALMSGSAEASAGVKNILAAQSLWDATMADSMAKYLKQNKNSLIVQLNGSFHSENHLGTVENLLRYQPKTKILVVTTSYEENFQTFDKTKMTGLGDFVILTDAKISLGRKKD